MDCFITKSGVRSIDVIFASENDKTWSIKRKRKSHSLTLVATSSENGSNGGDDPYSCKHLRIPSSQELVDMVVDDFIERWRALDQRKIIATEPAKPNEGSTENTLSLPKWYEKHVRLPEQFDYASVQEQPPHDDGFSGDRVISLVDPTATTSYHTELWKLFADIPTRQQLEDSVCDGSQMVHIGKWYNDVSAAIGRQCTTAQWDQFGLSRLRMNDRHGLPPIIPITDTDPVMDGVGDVAEFFCGLLRIECLRKELRRTSTPDSNRMVLEFLGSQTLLEVHEALVELTDDEFWTYNVEDHASAVRSSIRHPDSNEKDIVESNTVASTEEAAERTLGSSGYFFIEDTFYVSGSVDYTTPILNWLESGTERQQAQRLKHLGISTIHPFIRSMADIRLYDLPTRLGVRYVHVHHGDVECAVFVTDRRLMPKAIAGQIQFPIIHDIWTPSYSIPDCELCQNRIAVIATSTTCADTGGHRALCDQCGRQLRLQSTARDKIERYAVWRSQTDVSAGASNDTTW
jgi:hypothetical protein